MTIKRLLFLALFLGGGFASALVLPGNHQTQPAGVRLALPDFIGKWYGADQKVTDRELQMFAGDTEFARKLYTDGAGNAVFVSIVLSGNDLDNSIHRPERCLPAQGWTIEDSSRREVPLANNRELNVTRLHNLRQVPLRDGRVATIYNLNYYWFVGYHHLTASHMERTFFDIKDRVLHGYNQRWAYITVAADITEGFTTFGRSEKETDAMIQKFIAELVPYLQPNGEKSETPVASASR